MLMAISALRVWRRRSWDHAAAQILFYSKVGRKRPARGGTHNASRFAAMRGTRPASHRSLVCQPLQPNSSVLTAPHPHAHTRTTAGDGNGDIPRGRAPFCVVLPHVLG
jgi:hypothetical protein